MDVTSLSAKARELWRWRRPIYAVYMLVAVARIPARTGFQLSSPACDVRLTLENAGLSMTKLPHMILFGVYFLLTLLQFDRCDRRAVSWSFLGTLVLGLLVEFEEGATRTGNCRLTDVLPDLFGALVGMSIVMIVAMIRGRLLAEHVNRRS